ELDGQVAVVKAPDEGPTLVGPHPDLEVGVPPADLLDDFHNLLEHHADLDPLVNGPADGGGPGDEEDDDQARQGDEDHQGGQECGAAGHASILAPPNGLVKTADLSPG